METNWLGRANGVSEMAGAEAAPTWQGGARRQERHESMAMSPHAALTVRDGRAKTPAQPSTPEGEVADILAHLRRVRGAR